MERINKESVIGIVTVLYNSSTVVDEFFKTLAAQTCQKFILYVIDNNSPDDSLLKVKELVKYAPFKTVIFEEKENWGVAKGNNIGIERALKDGCQYVLLSNNDVVLEPATIQNLLSGMLDYGATMAVPKIYFHGTHLIWAAGGDFIYYSGYTKHRGLRRKDQGQFERVCPIKYAPTCFMLINSTVFYRIGMMDEIYFVYYDDTDFVWRATIRGDEKLMYFPSSRLWHKESTSVGGQQSDFVIKYMSRNLVYFIHKNLIFPQKMTVLLYHLLHDIIRKPFTYNAHQRDIIRNAVEEGKKMYNK